MTTPETGPVSMRQQTPSVWVQHKRDRPIKEMIAKPALSLRGLVIRTDKRSAMTCKEQFRIIAVTGVDLMLLAIPS